MLFVGVVHRVGGNHLMLDQETRAASRAGGSVRAFSVAGKQARTKQGIGRKGGRAELWSRPAISTTAEPVVHYCTHSPVACKRGHRQTFQIRICKLSSHCIAEPRAQPSTRFRDDGPAADGREREKRAEDCALSGEKKFAFPQRFSSLLPYCARPEQKLSTLASHFCETSLSFSFSNNSTDWPF